MNAALTGYVARRLVGLVAVVAVVSMTIFTLLYLAPGSPEQVLLGARPSSPETLEAIRAEHHLDEPFLTQFGIWIGNALQLDFGTSVRTSEPVLDTIEERFALTFQLGTFAFVLAMLVGVPLGMLAAVRRRTAVDRGVVGLSIVAASAPAFATGIALLYVFAVALGWFPVFGQGEGLADRVWHLTLPAVTLALAGMGFVLKLTRTAVIAALEQDCVTFARARGLSRRRVLLAYGLRNSLVPIVTAGGLILAYMLGGAVLVEVTFALPGLGSLLVESVTAKDLPMVQALTLLVAVMVVLINLAVDLLYLAIDPRIAFEGGAR